jgi:TPR repeat protein
MGKGIPKVTRQDLRDMRADTVLGMVFSNLVSFFIIATTAATLHAQFNLGVMYYMGEAGKQDYAQAKQWFEKATAQNNPRAEFNLGVMYYRGEGMAIDAKKALDLFTKAAEQNFNEAQFNVAVMLAKGEGTPQDIARAYAWFMLAKENGNPRVDETISELEKQMNAEQIAIVRKAAAEIKKTLIKAPVTK